MAVLESSALRIEVSDLGAELRSVFDLSAQQEWLWQGDSAYWTGRSPLLFPVVGQSPGGKVLIGKESFPMNGHGFARNSVFNLIYEAQDRLTYELSPSTLSKVFYPFDFRLKVQYRLVGNRLSVEASVKNLDDKVMPFQFGFHPAFNWAMPNAAGQLHEIVLANQAEPTMIRLGEEGLLDSTPLPSPFNAGVLALKTADFAAGAMVFPRGAGQQVTYRAGGSSIVMTTQNLPNFALWQKEGAGFICLEPWHGMAPFPAQGSALEARNFAQLLLPQTSQTFQMHLEFSA